MRIQISFSGSKRPLEEASCKSHCKQHFRCTFQLVLESNYIESLPAACPMYEDEAFW